jgi:hypothetical protein
MKPPLPIESVPFDSIEVDADDLRPYRLNKGDLTGLKKLIERFGLLVPPVVWKTLDARGKPRWVAIDGNRRVAALQDLKFELEAEEEGQQWPYPNINVSVFSGNLNAAKQLSAVLHLSAVQDNRGDQAVAAHYLETLAWKQTQIAEMSDQDQTWVAQSKMFAVGLAPAVLTRFRSDDAISVKQALDLVRLVGADGAPDAVAQLTVLEAPAPSADRPKKTRGPGRPPKANDQSS